MKVQGAQQDGKAPAALLTSDENVDLTEPNIPGVATITFTTNTTELPAGTQMIWTTQALSVEHKSLMTPQLSTSMSVH